MKTSVEFTFLLLALVGEILGTVGGFGSSVFFVPIANFYFDFQSVLGITALFHVASNLSKIALFRQGLDKRLVLYLGVPAVVFVIIGGILSKYLATTYLETALGIFLISLSLLFLIKRDLVIPDGNKEAITGGALSGLIAGVLGTGGAIRGLTMAAFNLEKSIFVATSAIIDFAVDFSRALVYLFNGFIKKEHLIPVVCLIGVAILGSWIGKRILKHLPQDKFKTISLLLILAIGILTLVKVIFS
jgi:uncharacterized protein